MAVLQISDVMCLCVFLHFTTGCTEIFPYISCSPGESVLLNCGDGNTRHTHVQWRHADFEESQHSVDVIQDPRFKGRVQIHGNLSLSISRLTVDDSGLYRCDLTAQVQLIIEGCSISGTETSVAMRRYSGESVFLSCSVECSTRFKPDEFIWKLPNHSRINQTTEPSELSRLYQGRVHMFDLDSGNFSLLINNLTERDEGLYVCWINDNQQKSFSLTIEGCTVSETEGEPTVKYPGDSVLLRCSCKDPKTKPEDFKWTRLDSDGTEVSIETSIYRARVQMFHETTPSNLSLLVFNLTDDDQGIYRCTINHNTSTDTSLTVRAVSRNPLTHSLTSLICVMLLLLATGFICRRFTAAKKGRRGSRVSQSPDHQDVTDDVTYSSVIRIKGGERTCRKEEVVYSSVADVRNSRSAQDDVIYSSVVYSKSRQTNTEEAGREDSFNRVIVF